MWDFPAQGWGFSRCDCRGGGRDKLVSTHVSACLHLLPSAGVSVSGFGMWVAALRYISRYIGGLEKWVSASLPCSCSVSPLHRAPIFFFSLNISPSFFFYSQVAPRIKTKHLRLSTPLPAAWIWVKAAGPVIRALFPLLSKSFLLV